MVVIVASIFLAVSSVQPHAASCSSDAQQAVALCAQRRFESVFDFHLNFAVQDERRAGATLPNAATVGNVDAVR